MDCAIIFIIVLQLHVDCAACKDENVASREGFGFPVTVEPGNTSDDEQCSLNTIIVIKVVDSIFTMTMKQVLHTTCEDGLVT